jgi:precorrin-6Y C5,15-methyltransferase (decarboxylating)
MTRWLAIIGIGEDGVEGLSPAACTLIRSAVLVVGGARHLALAEGLIRGARHLALAEGLIRGSRLTWPHPLSDAYPAILARRGEPVAVLASGDPYWFGIGGTLSALVPADETICLPAPSAFTLACARLGWALQDVDTLSFCGRPLEALLPRLQPGRRILALSADAATPASIAASLRTHGFGGSALHLLEALGGPRERHRRFTAAQPPPDDVGPLNLMAIEVMTEPGARVIPLAAGLPESLFEHDGQITKREVRAVTLSALSPRTGELLWDVGCGSGSIAIEWSLCHPANRAIGIEMRVERAERARRNALSLGVPQVRIVTGPAPVAFAGLPTPDAIFIGGGAASAMDASWEALRTGGRIIVNAVTIDTEARLFEAQRRHGGTLTRLAVERLDTIGNMRGFQPAKTITQWAAEKP